MINFLAFFLLLAGQDPAPNGAIIFARDIVPIQAAAPPVIRPMPVFDLHPAHRATVVRVHDGDTALFRLDLEAGVSVETWIRLEGFNSPELHGPNKDLAAKATQALTDLLAGGEVWVKTTGDMTFARYVGRVYIRQQDGTAFDVSVRMAELGYAVEQGQ